MDKRSYERKRAKDMGVNLNSGSGAVSDDADFRYEDFLIEHKYRKKNTIWISIAWWKKVRKQALIRRRKPCIIFENDDCSVAYFEFGDINLLKDKFNLEVVSSSCSKVFKNKNYIDKLSAARDAGKIYIIEYIPEKLMVVEIEDFKDLVKKE